jgi:hypothetical protein
MQSTARLITKLLTITMSLTGGIVLFSAQLLYSQTFPRPAHTLIVLEENHAYEQIIGSSAAPYINSLADSGALFTNSYAITHPSQPNYLDLFSGCNQGVTDDNLPSGTPFTTANLGAELIAKGYTFSGYSEDLPSVGYLGATSGNYARKHCPWVNWQGTGVYGIPAVDNQPFTSFPSDYDSLPTVCFVIANLNDEMHNGSDPTTITTGDNWLKNNLGNYITWANSHNSLLILTWDEDNDAYNNHIATILTGEMVKQGQYNENINHYSVLRTIEDLYGLTYACNSSSASSVSDCWNITAGINEAKDQFQFSNVYPDPAVNEVNVEITNSDLINKECVLKIFNVTGVEVLENPVFSLHEGKNLITVNTSSLNSGMYFSCLTEKESGSNWHNKEKILIMK